MSQKSLLKINRRDKLNKIDSYTKIYDTKILSYINKKYQLSILRIIKKSILGCNFCYSYTKQNLFASAIANFFIINTCFLIFPQVIFNSIFIAQSPEIENFSKIDNDNLLYIDRKEFLIRLSISNFIDIAIITFISLFYKYKERKINKYMEIYTQCAIKEENDILITNKYFCEILSDEFDIEIKKVKNISNNKINSEEYFFNYIINFPNIRGISKFLYKKALTVKEKEIINNINIITDEIDYKYKKKLLKFILIIVSILVCIPIFSLMSGKKKLDFINYIGIFFIFIYVQCNIFLSNKKEQINKVNLLNERFIKDGYFIYINNDIISIFYLKEEYQKNGDVSLISNMNQKLMEKLKINF